MSGTRLALQWGLIRASCDRLLIGLQELPRDQEQSRHLGEPKVIWTMVNDVDLVRLRAHDGEKHSAVIRIERRLEMP